jgi:hypothetical protein
VSPAVRTTLVLAGCLLVLGLAGWLATTALWSATVAPTQVANAPVVVDANVRDGAAKLTVLTPVGFGSGADRRVVPAGTQFSTASALLTDALPPRAAAGVGATLTCDLRIGMSRGAPVIDLVRCHPSVSTPRG